MTIFAGQHNPYENDLEQDGLGQVFQGTKGLVQSTQMVWEFISPYSKDDVQIEA